MSDMMPYKGQNLIYRAIGGDRYPAVVTDIGPKGVSITVTGDTGWKLNLNAVRFVTEWLPSDGDAVCHPPRATEQDDAAA